MAILIAPQRIFCRLERIHQLAGTAHQGLSGIQLLILTRLQPGPLQLLNLISQRVHPPAPLRLVHLQRSDLPPFLTHGLIAALIVFQKVPGPAEAVQIVQVALRVQKLLPVVLPMNIQQLPPQLPELGYGQRPSVYPAYIPAVPLDLPLEQQFLPLWWKAVILQPSELGEPSKNGCDQRRPGPGADEFAAGPLSQNSANCVDDDGFSRAGLAGKHIEAAIKSDIRRLNDSDILNMEQRKHGIPPFCPQIKLLQQLVNLAVKGLGGSAVAHDQNACVIPCQTADDSRNLHIVQSGTGS